MTREWLLHLIKILRDDTSFTMRFEVKKAKLQNRFFGRREKSSRTHSRASGYKAQNATYFSALFFGIDYSLLFSHNTQAQIFEQTQKSVCVW